MQFQVRLVHAVETIPYYGFYGFLLATWFTRRDKGAAPNAGVEPQWAAPAA